MRRWTDILWPTLEPVSDMANAQRAAEQRQDLADIAAAVIKGDEDTLVEEARRVFDAETDRRKTADVKATTYLTIAGIVAPILASITPTALVAGQGRIQTAVTVAIFLTTLAYLLGSGRWAFRTLAVSASSRLDARELIQIWTGGNPRAELAKGLLECVRLNRDGVNQKVSAIKMAHAFGWRAFVSLMIAVLVRAAWSPLAATLQAVF
ncbi:MAG: hypothetical protein HYU62_03795 [Caulobacterales bacterium]|nr:hypothetical protein [Caulobacterales bacterium]